MTTLINLTPHPVQILTRESAAPITVPPRPREAGGAARVAEVVRPLGELLADLQERIGLVAVSYGEVAGLPEEDPLGGVAYIVSRMIAEACPGRADLYFPMDVVRDAQGRVLYARSLGRSER